MFNINKFNLSKEFNNIFNEKEGLKYYFSPGRVNIIGEHIDYNGGIVMPMAIDLGNYFVVRKRTDNLLRVYSEKFSCSGIIEIDLKNLEFRKERTWTNYLLGAFFILNKINKKIPFGFDIFIIGNLPNGAGLSSSASISLGMTYILNDFYNLNLNKIDLIKISRDVENKYMKIECGIMDQFAIAMSKANKALTLNCTDLNYEYLDLNIHNKKFLIINSNKKRELQNSDYNIRKRETEIALNSLNQYYSNNKRNNLCDFSYNELESAKKFIIQCSNEEIYKRARHCIKENQRVLEFKQAIKEDNMNNISKLMLESHKSLKDDYKVSIYELDLLVELSIKFSKNIGIRMTGAGFGGCLIAIIDELLINEYKDYIRVEYENKTNIKPSFYIVKSSESVGEFVV